MSVINKVVKKIKFLYNSISFYIASKKKTKFNVELRINDIKSKFISLRSEYLYFYFYFNNSAPNWLRDHRKYFSMEKRGFGEDAFHSMWYLLFKEYSPKNVLEIGVYRGQTISLFSLISKNLSLNSDIHAISPFTSSADKVSLYLDNLNYLEDVKSNFNYFELPIPTLHVGFSTDPDMLKIIRSRKWDLIYIDGNHDYEVVKADFAICSQNLSKNGIIVLDDASLYNGYFPFGFSTAGHPGPSRVASEIDLNLFKEILSVGHNRVFALK